MATAKAKKQAVTKVVEIPRVNLESFDVTIEGISSLLCHKFSDRSKTEMLNKQMKKATSSRAAKNPEQDYEDSKYIRDDGTCGFPVGGIKDSCVGAAYTFVDNIPKTRARGAFRLFQVDPDSTEYAPIIGESRMREDVVRLGGKTADLRYRAEFPQWSITFRVLCNPRVISKEGIVNLLEHAGFHVGIGDWRPEKNGSHGMFRVKRG